MAMQTVTVEKSVDDILKQPIEGQIADLVRIAFENRKDLKTFGDVLFGNGKVGVCEVVRRHNKYLIWLWSMVTLVGGSIIGVLYTHLVVK